MFIHYVLVHTTIEVQYMILSYKLIRPGKLDSLFLISQFQDLGVVGALGGHYSLLISLFSKILKLCMCTCAEPNPQGYKLIKYM